MTRHVLNSTPSNSVAKVFGSVEMGHAQAPLFCRVRACSFGFRRVYSRRGRSPGFEPGNNGFANRCLPSRKPLAGQGVKVESTNAFPFLPLPYGRLGNAPRTGPRGGCLANAARGDSSGDRGNDWPPLGRLGS